MLQLIESTFGVRQALGPILGLIQKLSDLDGERRQTRRLREVLLNKYPRYCAACGAYFSQSEEAQAAHIVALEEGGVTTEDNLVLLCKDCHALYDGGRASIAEMSHAAECWRSESLAPLRPQMECRNLFCPSESFRPSRTRLLDSVYHLVHRNETRNALRHVKLCRTKGLPAPDHVLSIILEAQIQRRRCARGSLEKARGVLTTMEISNVPAEHLPLYFYEQGYISQLLGLHTESICFFEQSGRASEALNDRFTPFEVTVARTCLYGVETIVLPHQKVPRDTQRKRSAEFDALQKGAAKFDEPFAGRWALNILAWKWRYYFKCNDHDSASNVLAQYFLLHRSRDFTTGYTRGSSTGLCSMRALMNGAHLGSENGDCVRLVCRSLVSMLSYRVPPEGVRDLLLTLERAISGPNLRILTDREAVISHIRRVRSCVRDGSSFLDPYRAGSSVSNMA
jgi:hypothetical protein